MDLGLYDKVALVTGASSGIGAATAKLLAKEGADVVVCYRQHEEGASRIAQLVQNAGRRSWLCQMDVSDAHDVSSAIARLRVEVDKFDVLVLCAGQNIVTPFDELTTGEWDQIINVNLNGPFYVLRAVLPMLRQGASVVTVKQRACHTPAHRITPIMLLPRPVWSMRTNYVRLTKSAARALAPRVRVNCVAPAYHPHTDGARNC